MIDLGIIITGIIGFLSSIISAWCTWFFTRKKYNSEVDNNLINNMNDSLNFYKQLSDDNKDRLDEVLKRNERLEKEVRELRTQMINLMGSICVDLSCQLRKRDMNLFKTNINETSTKENI